MQVCVIPHQKRPLLLGGTVGSGSDQMNLLFQNRAEHRPGRSVLNLPELSLMPHLLPSEWPASLQLVPDEFYAYCGLGFLRAPLPPAPPDRQLPRLLVYPQEPVLLPAKPTEPEQRVP